MKIQLSPWHVGKTSLKIPVDNQRRRKRSISDEADVGNGVEVASQASSLPPMVASFVHNNLLNAKTIRSKSNRSQYRYNPSSSSTQKESSITLDSISSPEIAVTGENQISVIGSALFEADASTTLFSSSASLCESTRLQYTTKPGNSSTSYMSNRLEGKSCPPNIAALFDPHNECVYAFQKNNTKLICYSASSSTTGKLSSSPFPDPKNENHNEIMASVILTKPAHSLSIVQDVKRPSQKKYHIIGSCVDGTTFIIRRRDNMLQIDSDLSGENKALSSDTKSEKRRTNPPIATPRTFQLEVEYLLRTDERDDNNGSTKSFIKLDSEYVGCASYLTISNDRITDIRMMDTKLNVQRQSTNDFPSYDEIVHCKVYFIQKTNTVMFSKEIIHVAYNNNQEQSQLQQFQLYETITMDFPLKTSMVQFDDINMNLFIQKLSVLGFVDDCNAIVLSFNAAIRKAAVFVTNGHKNGKKPSNGVVEALEGHENSFYIVLPVRNCIQNNNIPTSILSCVPLAIRLPSKTKRVHLIGTNSMIVAETTCNRIMFYDAVRGGELYCESLSSILWNDSQNESEKYTIDTWTLVTDESSSKIALLFMLNTEAYVAISSIQYDDNSLMSSAVVPTSKRLSLACGLANSFANKSSSEDSSGVRFENRCIMGYGAETVSSAHNLTFQQNDMIQSGMKLLESVMNPSLMEKSVVAKNKRVNKNAIRLRDAFNDAVAMVAEYRSQVNSLMGSLAGNPSALEETDPLMLAPQCFIDAVMKFVLRLILGRTNKAVQADIHLDALTLLQRLIQTGKLSSRYHFQRLFDENCVTDENANMYSLSTLLCSISVKDGEEKTSTYSSVSLIFDILDHCNDVTERQFVSFVKFMLSHSSAADFALYFVGACPGNEQMQKLSKEIMGLKGKMNTKDSKKQHESIGNKLILTGTWMLLQKMATLTDYNEALLRAAVVAELTLQEISLLSNLLLKPFHCGVDLQSADNSIQRKMNFLTALCGSKRYISVGDGDYNEIGDIRNDISPKINILESFYTLHESKRLHNTGDGISDADFYPKQEIATSEKGSNSHVYKMRNNIVNGSNSSDLMAGKRRATTEVYQGMKNGLNGILQHSKLSQNEPVNKKSKSGDVNKLYHDSENDEDAESDAYLLDSF